MNDDGGTSSSASRPRILGICGGIGSGKSSVCTLLVEKLGCVSHLDADKLAHSIYDRGSAALQEIASEFGRQILTDEGEINRPALGSIVFGDPSKMKTLERIVWPHVKQKVLDEINRIRTTSEDSEGDGTIVVEAAMLLDAGWYDFMDGVWVIRVDRDVALDRLISQRGLTSEEAEKRMRAQSSRRGMTKEALEQEVEAGVVTRVVDNNDSLDELTGALREALDDPASWKSTSPAAKEAPSPTTK
jgi:dephospho-CoA kinase